MYEKISDEIIRIEKVKTDISLDKIEKEKMVT